MLAIDLTELEFKLEFDDKQTGLFVVGWKCSCVVIVGFAPAAVTVFEDEAATAVSDRPLVDDVMSGNLSGTFDTTGLTDVQSN